MKEVSCGRRGETQKGGKGKKQAPGESRTQIFNVHNKTGLSQQNLEIFTENRLTSYFSKEDLKDKN